MNQILKTILERNEKFDLKFEEETHKYFILNNIELISTTTKLNKYFPFNREKISREVAERNWVCEDEVLDEWEILAKNGSYLHLLAERYANGKKLSEENLKHINHIIKFFKENPNYEVLGTEIKIFSKKYSIAGTIDLLLKEKQTNRIYTLDWKTSRREILKDDIWEMAKKPFEKIPNNKFYKYSLQIWIYNEILKEEYKIDVWDSLIVHLKSDLKTYRIIEPCQMSYEAKEFLNL